MASKIPPPYFPQAPKFESAEAAGWNLWWQILWRRSNTKKSWRFRENMSLLDVAASVLYHFSLKVGIPFSHLQYRSRSIMENLLDFFDCEADPSTVFINFREFIRDCKGLNADRRGCNRGEMLTTGHVLAPCNGSRFLTLSYLRASMLTRNNLMPLCRSRKGSPGVPLLPFKA